LPNRPGSRKIGALRSSLLAAEREKKRGNPYKDTKGRSTFIFASPLRERERRSIHNSCHTPSGSKEKKERLGWPVLEGEEHDEPLSPLLDRQEEIAACATASCGERKGRRRKIRSMPTRSSSPKGRKSRLNTLPIKKGKKKKEGHNGSLSIFFIHALSRGGMRKRESEFLADVRERGGKTTVLSSLCSVWKAVVKVRGQGARGKKKEPSDSLA